jgi:diketogulonate reductase-like aldo/keto reductase
MEGRIVAEPAIKKLSVKYNKTPAQIVLRWNLEHHVVTIPKSVHTHRLIENTQIFDFNLSQADINVLDDLDKGRRVGPDPDNFNF